MNGSIIGVRINFHGTEKKSSRKKQGQILPCKVLELIYLDLYPNLVFLKLAYRQIHFRVDIIYPIQKVAFKIILASIELICQYIFIKFYYAISPQIQDKYVSPRIECNSSLVFLRSYTR